jgi:hypothetical protein
MRVRETQNRKLEFTFWPETTPEVLSRTPHPAAMSEYTPVVPSGVDALSTFEALEIEYASARIFRRLLIPRLFVFSVAVSAAVLLARLPWPPLMLVLGLDAGLIGFAIRRERRTRRRWASGCQRLARSLGIRQQIDIRPTVR